jgi:hypothetical protein
MEHTHGSPNFHGSPSNQCMVLHLESGSTETISEYLDIDIWKLKTQRISNMVVIWLLVTWYSVY